MQIETGIDEELIDDELSQCHMEILDLDLYSLISSDLH
jgi:hypothetical protein